MAKGRRRWVRNTTKIRDEFAAGISLAAIDLVLAHVAYREIIVPDWVNKVRTRTLVCPDQSTWYTQPVDFHKLAIGILQVDEAMGNAFIQWMIDEKMIHVHQKRKV